MPDRTFPLVVHVLIENRCAICSLAVVLKLWLDHAVARRRQRCSGVRQPARRGRS